MDKYFTPKQIFVLAATLIAFSILAIGWFCMNKHLPAPVQIEAAQCPVWGKKDAPIQMVLFEDFRCSGCKMFNLHLLPQIQTEYIDRGYVRFTLVPLAFIQGSKPLGNAALAVYHLAPDRFLPYMRGLCQGLGDRETKTSIEEQLINLAKVVGGIDLLQFKACVKTNCYEGVLEKNFALAKEVMGSDLGTPTLYINGVPGSTVSFEAIQKMMNHFLEGLP